MPGEGGAVELNAGAAVGVAPSSEEEVRVSMFVGRRAGVCRVGVELSGWGVTVGAVGGSGAGGGG